MERSLSKSFNLQNGRLFGGDNTMQIKWEDNVRDKTK
jgi:hypothetical protein